LVAWVISAHLIAKIGLFVAGLIFYTGGEPMVRLGLRELGHTSAQLALLGDQAQSPFYAAHRWIARRFSQP
jgi:hypothetical protein